MFTVTLKIMTHMGILSDRQITLYRIHAQKRLCKRNFYFSGKHVEIKNSPYGRGEKVHRKLVNTVDRGKYKCYT